MTPTRELIDAQFLVDTVPATLPTLPGTWRSLETMGVDVSAGNYEFFDPGTHIQQSYHDYWGWWKTDVLGFYAYTELRDVEMHERQGLGRPWLALLPEAWQELIFRELIFLVQEWNALIAAESRFTFQGGMPNWMLRWLSLTNRSWRQGTLELEEEVLRYVSEVDEQLLARFVTRYQLSGLTWRRIMPERAVYHRKYAERPEFYTFERPELLGEEL